MPFVRGPDGQLTHHTPSKQRNAKDALQKKEWRPRYLTHAPTGDRESSRDKRVSFGRRLERGPSPAYSRNRTPSRPALAKHLTGTTETINVNDVVVTSDGSDADSPSDQLWAEETSATNRRSSGQRERIPHNGPRPTPLTSDFQRLNPLPATECPDLKDITDETQRDDEVCRRVHKLRARVVDFATEFVYDNNMTLRKEGCLEGLCGDIRNAQLVRYIGCLAQGGPDREESWQELLIHPECRIALVVGIIGTALKEHVFSELWFSGTDEQIEELEALQEKQKHGEGYERTKQRARACNRYADDDDLPASRKVAMALQKLLTPLYNLGQKRSQAIPKDLSTSLFTIVSIAGILSREMRRCGDVIYHWPPTFKDEEFDPNRMECINIGSMISNSPFEKKIVNGREQSALREPTDKDEAIVKIVAFPGLVVHRQGGGALAKRLLAEEDQANDHEHANLPPDVQRVRRMAIGDKLTGDEGFRTRVMCKSVVHLIWGRQRLLTREAGTSAHIDAMRDGKEKKYQDDRKGYIELYDYFLANNPDAAR